MIKVKSGDLDRMGLLFERHYKQLYGFLFRMSFDKEGSEDMVQNVFLRMLKYRHTYVGNGDFKPWMYHLARNVLNDFFKANGRMNMVGESEAVQIPDNETSRWIEKQEEAHLVNKAMNTLSEENREILILSRYQELAYTEIASILNISEANVRVRIHRAMSQLKTNYLKLADA